MNYLTQDPGLDHPYVEMLKRLKPDSHRLRLILEYGFRCHWCKRFCNPGANVHSKAYPTIEHLVRLVDGGRGYENKRIACLACNTARHSKDWAPGVKPKKVRKLRDPDGWPDGRNYRLYWRDGVYPKGTLPVEAGQLQGAMHGCVTPELVDTRTECG